MSKFKKAKNYKPSTYAISTVHVFSDGSFRPDDNASFAYLLFSESTKHVLKAERQACRGGTINQMELMAVDKALDYPNLSHVVVHTDSAYVIGCLSLWRHNWAHNNWITPSGTPVKNKELIQSIGRKMDRLKSVAFEKVKAHTGDPFNSVVDFLAQGMSKRMCQDKTIIDLCETW